MTSSPAQIRELLLKSIDKDAKVSYFRVEQLENVKFWSLMWDRRCVIVSSTENVQEQNGRRVEPIAKIQGSVNYQGDHIWPESSHRIED